MKNKRILRAILIVLGVICCTIFVAFMVEPDKFTEHIVAFISLTIAFLALFISLMTFISIDEVNAISRMDGNVMENSNYNPNILGAVVRFNKVDLAESSEDVISYMNNLFNNNKLSGAHLADNVQEVADLMILVPFFIRTNDKQKSAISIEKINKLLSKMRTHVTEFKGLTDGSCKLLEETVNLIDAVFSYQKISVGASEDNAVKLLQVRGSMFINPISSILYYNYLGLYFHQKAKLLEVKSQNDTLQIIYLKEALKNFKIALSKVKDDMIWKAFIYHNKARTEYRLYCHENNNKQKRKQKSKYNWLYSIDESSRYWITVNRMIAEHFSAVNNEKSWIQQSLISQENKIRLTKILYQIETNQPLTDSAGQLWLKNYKDLLKTDFYKSIPNVDPLGRTNEFKIKIEEKLALL